MFMLARIQSAIASIAWFAAVLLAAPAQAQDCSRIDQCLQGQGAAGYTLTPLTEDYLYRTFPGRTFCSVIFRQYPVGVDPPKGLEYSNVGLIARDQIRFFTTTSDLRDFFAQLGATPDPEAELDGGRTWLRLAEELDQDLYFTFSDPDGRYADRASPRPNSSSAKGREVAWPITNQSS
jgi:hypothetical protein